MHERYRHRSQKARGYSASLAGPRRLSVSPLCRTPISCSGCLPLRRHIFMSSNAPFSPPRAPPCHRRRPAPSPSPGPIVPCPAPLHAQPTCLSFIPPQPLFPRRPPRHHLPTTTPLPSSTHTNTPTPPVSRSRRRCGPGSATAGRRCAQRRCAPRTPGVGGGEGAGEWVQGLRVVWRARAGSRGREGSLRSGR